MRNTTHPKRQGGSCLQVVLF